MANPIVFYGERGLVNGLVLELNGNIHLTKKFLKKIKFCKTKSPDWIDCIKKTTLLVEPSFSEFGNPDLVIVCDCEGTKGAERHVIFLEAKVVKYDDSAVPLQGTGNKDLQGINSRINAQLTLKYRLARALKKRLKGQPVQEGLEDWGPYANYPTESQKKPRRLLKSLGLQLCDDFLLGIHDYWFVALTADDTTAQPFKTHELKPVVLDPGGSDLWECVQNHFGLVVYEDLDSILGENGAYSNARKYFLPKPPHREIVGQVVKTTLSLRTENWKTFGSTVHEVRPCLQKLVEKAIDAVLGAGAGPSSRVEHNGSDSYQLGSRTLIKLVPHRTEAGERLLLAVSEGFATAAGLVEEFFSEGPYLIGIGTNARTFVGKAFITCPTAEEESEHSWALITFCQVAIEQ